MDLVDAQQARRVLDRIVGYKISPVLWAKVKRGLSAGRVQSVALRIIADREDEIAAFIPEEYWSLDANFKVKGEKSMEQRMRRSPSITKKNCIRFLQIWKMQNMKWSM